MKRMILALILASLSAPSWAGAPRTEAELVARLETLSDEEFIPAITEALRARGCSIFTEADVEEVVQAELAQYIVKLVGYDELLSRNAVDEIIGVIYEAGRMMFERGELTQAEDQTITLVDCE